MMSNRWHLMRMDQVSPGLPTTPAGQALARNLVTRMDLLRLKAIARLQARGLPPEVGWADLLQEAFARVLDGSRTCPAGLPMVVFMAGVIRSIRAEHCRRARRAAAELPRLRAELDFRGPEDQVSDPTVDLERSLIAMQQLAEIDRLFADDLRALQIMEGLFEGWSPEEIRVRYDIPKTEYDSTRKRMRRVFLREGLRWSNHDS